MATITESDGTVTKTNPEMSLAESGNPGPEAWDTKLTFLSMSA
jgi:hypothetical protein